MNYFVTVNKIQACSNLTKEQAIEKAKAIKSGFVGIGRSSFHPKHGRRYTHLPAYMYF